MFPFGAGARASETILGILETWARANIPGRLRDVAHFLYDRRRVAVSEGIRRRCGDTVQRGPFEGMAYPIRHRHGGSKCLGTYERELHPMVERIIARGYETILNIGCGEGYYAVGLARRMPSATVVAVDYNPAALAACRRLAIANGIHGDRILYRLEATHELLAELGGSETLVLVDVEGAEFRLLDPTAAPRLLQTDILVELHEHASPGIETVVRARFSHSHVIRSIPSEPRRDATDYPELWRMSSHSRLLALTERPFPMTWLMLTHRPM